MEFLSVHVVNNNGNLSKEFIVMKYVSTHITGSKCTLNALCFQSTK